MRWNKIKHTTAAVALMSLAACTAGVKPAADPELESRIDKLLSQMTLEEKMGQMNQISSYGNIEVMSTMIKRGEIGSILNEVDPVRVNALQRVAMEESRLGIPLLIARDVIHGFKTVFPIPLGQAASFDTQVAYNGARVAATEASAVGIRWTFAPMIDIARDPRWGRMAEGCGEDPYLTSVMGAAMVRGFQADSLADPTAIAACAKHFVGYGAAEGGRDYNSTFISERQLRNVYLPPFKAAAEAGSATFMTSFNDNDGVPSTANKFVLKDILRGEWNYDGMVVTDWASAAEMITHGYASDSADAAQKSINAGVDMEMVSYTFYTNIPDLLKSGAIKMADIDNAVRNVLRLKFRLGLFDNPYVDEKRIATDLYAPEHLAAAKEAAVKSAILLKNDASTLPLGADVKRVAIVGPLADAPHDQLGTWTFDGEKTHTVTPLEAIRQLVGDKVDIIYEPGLRYSRDNDASGIARAAAAARRADVVLAFVGEEAILSGEAHSLADLNLKGAQSQLISQLAATGKPVVTIVMAGRPLTIGREVEQSAAVLYNFHPGTMGGPAIADLLWGNAVPSGKTPVTFPRMTGQVPIYYCHNNSGRPATRNEVLIDDIPLEAGQTSLGCTSFYLDAGFDPLFPFGFGLSYTEFAYGKPVLSASEFTAADTITVQCDITNTGSIAATEVAQLYVQDVVGSVTRPVKELKRFERITIEPEQTATVRFSLPVSDLAFWNSQMKYGVEPGNFRLWVATNSQSGEAVGFRVK